MTKVSDFSSNPYDYQSIIAMHEDAYGNAVAVLKEGVDLDNPPTELQRNTVAQGKLCEKYHRSTTAVKEELVYAKYDFINAIRAGGGSEKDAEKLWNNYFVSQDATSVRFTTFGEQYWKDWHENNKLLFQSDREIKVLGDRVVAKQDVAADYAIEMEDFLRTCMSPKRAEQEAKGLFGLREQKGAGRPTYYAKEAAYLAFKDHHFEGARDANKDDILLSELGQSKQYRAVKPEMMMRVYDALQTQLADEMMRDKVFEFPKDGTKITVQNQEHAKDILEEHVMGKRLVPYSDKPVKILTPLGREIFEERFSELQQQLEQEKLNAKSSVRNR